jgi:Tfp pilus assembly protein PilX
MRTPRHERGSVLLTAMILLTVLMIIGVAAVRLASQERVNAAAKGKLEFSQSCANAAVAKIYAEMSNSGLGYLGGGLQVTAMPLPDGTTLTAPAHYGQATGAAAPLVKDVTFRVESTTGSAQQAERDCTNKLCGPNDLGRTYNVTAHCKDAHGREAEVELALKFAI